MRKYDKQSIKLRILESAVKHRKDGVRASEGYLKENKERLEVAEKELLEFKEKS